ncbi:BnaA07g01030D [Brassica napus]|uniref:BnaA07g01030D protein n=1 Tax=Brassica napus TaxID=3708 RepID=A0A078HEM2_BRANA|nr:BnaA07g01030D [Brassica napus]
MVRLDDDNGFLIQEGTATTLLQGSIFRELFTSSRIKLVSETLLLLTFKREQAGTTT